MKREEAIKKIKTGLDEMEKMGQEMEDLANSHDVRFSALVILSVEAEESMFIQECRYFCRGREEVAVHSLVKFFKEFPGTVNDALQLAEKDTDPVLQ